MTKQKLVEIICKILKTDTELDFLELLKEEDLQTLVACIRNRVDYG